MPARTLSCIIECADALPSLQSAVVRLISAMADERLGIEAQALHVASDPALTARILAAANAGVYGTQRVVTIPQAISLLGANRIEDIAVQGAILEVFSDCEVPDSLRYLWLESIAAAVCAEEVAAQAGANRAIAHVAGLLHDIGKLLLYAVLRNEYLDVLDQVRRSGRPISEVEREILGFDHAMVGSELARTWRLPDVIVEAILGHTASLGSNVVRSPMADIVNVGVAIAHAMDLVGRDDNCVPLMDEESCLRAGLRWERLPAMLARIEGRFIAARETLGECRRRCGPTFCPGVCAMPGAHLPNIGSVAGQPAQAAASHTSRASAHQKIVQ